VVKFFYKLALFFILSISITNIFCLTNQVDKNLSLSNKKVKNLYFNYPNYPFYSLPYFKDTFFNIEFSSSWANKGFTSSGGCHNLSTVIFKNQNILLKDIFETSNLLYGGYLNAIGTTGPYSAPFLYKNLYSYVLAEKFLKFNASTAKNYLNFSMQHYFSRPSISFGVAMPVVHRKNKIKMESKLSIAERQALYTNTPAFFQKYEDLEDFFEKILTAKNIGYNRCDSELGFGDVTFFASTKIKNKNFESIITGLRVVLPTGYYKDRTDKLWNPDFGNGGFYELGYFFALHKKYDKIINPYCFVDFSFSLPSKVYRRIPKYLTYDGVNPRPDTPVKSNLLLGGDTVYYKAYNTLDTTIAAFADDSVRVKAYKGLQVLLRLGNTIDEVLFKDGFLDFYYEFSTRAGENIIKSSVDTAKYEINLFKKDRFELEHKLAINYSYLFKKFQRFTLGFNCIIYGKNVPKTFEAKVGFSKDF